MTVPALAFDYAALAPGLADAQRARAARIAGLKRRTVEAMGEIGRELLAAQADLEHGTFLAWVEAEAGLSKSAAYRFMDVARAFSADELPTLGSLPHTVVHALAAASTPVLVRAAVVTRMKAGEVVEADAVLVEVREAREAARSRAADEREAARRARLSDEARAEEDALRAKGEKGRAARERREARERQATFDRGREAARQAAEAVAPLAALLVDRLGPDLAAALFASPEAAARSLAQAAGNLAQARRAAASEFTDVPAEAVACEGGPPTYLRTAIRDAEAEGVAARIRAGEDVPPVVVVPCAPSFLTSSARFRVVAGHATFRAFAGPLGWVTVPVQIAPPVPSLDEAAKP